MHIRSSNRQTSIFATKPTHMRIKTQTDCSKENFKAQKNFMVKRPMKSCRISQFDLKVEDKAANKRLSMKRPIAQRSLFGEINLYMPKFKKQNIFPNQLEHPLKQYINAGNPQTLKRTIKRFRTNCETQISPSKKINTDLSLIRYSYQQSEPVTQQNLSQLSIQHKLIDQIYKKIGKFKEVGYTEKKINEWILKYCLHKRKYMTHLLMKSSNKHKFSQTFQDYFYEKDPAKVKQKLLSVTKKINGKEKHIDQYDLMEFSNYIEQILIQKNRLKIFQLKDSITQKLEECFIYNRQRNEYQFGKKLYPPDLLNFVSDLQELQQRQGRFDHISTFNREYFDDLGKTQKDIRTKIYQLIKITEHSKKKLDQKQIIKSPAINLDQLQEKDGEMKEKIKIMEVSDVQNF